MNERMKNVRKVEGRKDLYRILLVLSLSRHEIFEFWSHGSTEKKDPKILIYKFFGHQEEY